MLPLPSNRGLHLFSSDRRFGIYLGIDHIAALVDGCQRASTRETGGVLIGYYNPNHDLAFVTEVASAPPDSKYGPNWFDRGVKGITKKLKERWKRTESFYLGEWHYHPGAAPDPSPTDSSQMVAIANSPQYACPEPILLIVGGRLGAWTVGAFVYEKKGVRRALSRWDCESHPGGEDG